MQFFFRFPEFKSWYWWIYLQYEKDHNIYDFFHQIVHHNFKKLRNNFLKSSTGKSPHLFEFCGHQILWSWLKEEFMYDVETNPISTFKFLTLEHFDPSSASKMRNYLADVLGKRMLEVLKALQTK